MAQWNDSERHWETQGPPQKGRNVERWLCSSHGIVPAQKLNLGLQERTPSFPLLESASPWHWLLRAVLFGSRFAIGKFCWEKKERSDNNLTQTTAKTLLVFLSCCVSLGEFEVKIYKNGEATGIFWWGQLDDNMVSTNTDTNRTKIKVSVFLVSSVPFYTIFSLYWRHVGSRRHKYLQVFCISLSSRYSFP